jgi:peptidyl-prolyl cis-trans isomerase C
MSFLAFNSSAPGQPWPGARSKGVLLAAIGLLLAGCHRPASQTPVKTSPVLAKVGGQEITVADLQAEAARRGSTHRAVPDKAVLLEEMIDREATLQRARRAGLDQDPEVRREFENLLIARLTTREVSPRREAIAITPEMIQAEYQAHHDRYTRPEQARLAMLFLAAGAKASEAHRSEIRARLEEARGQVTALQTTNRSRGVVGFGPLGLRYSDDAVSRHRGGDLGWLSQGERPPRIPEAVLAAGWKLDKGAVSDVIEAPDGFYLIMKTDLREAFTTPLETLRPAIRQSLLVREQKQVEDAFREETRAAAAVEVFTQALAAVTLPVPDPRTIPARDNPPQPPPLGANLSHHAN